MTEIKDSRIAALDQRYIRINKVRKEFLDRFLPGLIKSAALKTALDVGCGFGYFSKYLRDLGLQVIASDARPENIAETKRRNPEIKCELMDIENPAATNSGSFDTVLCFGLLYHLENPLRAIRNLFALTKKILIMETMAAPFKSQIAVLCEEEVVQDQGLNYLALILSESSFVKVLYKSGFPYVYRSTSLPRHKEFRSSLIVRRRRTILTASKVPLKLPILKLTHSSTRTNRYIYYRGIGSILEYLRLRKILKK